jgi:hypothetical protein
VLLLKQNRNGTVSGNRKIEFSIVVEIRRSDRGRSRRNRVG